MPTSRSHRTRHLLEGIAAHTVERLSLSPPAKCGVRHITIWQPEKSVKVQALKTGTDIEVGVILDSADPDRNARVARRFADAFASELRARLIRSRSGPKGNNRMLVASVALRDPDMDDALISHVGDLAAWMITRARGVAL